MKCENCDKFLSTKDCVKVLKGGKPFPITFCSYECYLAFWRECVNFEPLPEYIRE